MSGIVKRGASMAHSPGPTVGQIVARYCLLERESDLAVVLEGVMDQIVFSPNSCVEALTLNATIWSGAFKVVINFK